MNKYKIPCLRLVNFNNNFFIVMPNNAIRFPFPMLITVSSNTKMYDLSTVDFHKICWMILHYGA